MTDSKVDLLEQGLTDAVVAGTVSWSGEQLSGARARSTSFPGGQREEKVVGVWPQPVTTETDRLDDVGRVGTPGE